MYTSWSRENLRLRDKQACLPESGISEPPCLRLLSYNSLELFRNFSFWRTKDSTPTASKQQNSLVSVLSGMPGIPSVPAVNTFIGTADNKGNHA
jgi:hypothetical protein